MKIFFSAILILNSLFSNDAYVLTSRINNAGFFSIFHEVLGALDAYDTGGFSGLTVNFENRGCYYDPDRGCNWWEYYFEPITLGECTREPQKFAMYQKIDFSLTGEWIIPKIRCNELIEKYIKLKPHIEMKVKLFFEKELANHFCVGVHYRGTDKSSEAPLVPYEDAYRIIRDSVIDHNSKIFVATDDAFFLDYLENQFPEQIFATTAFRSRTEESVHENDNFNPYKKGEEALIDCILLSKCDLLIKTASNLSDASISFNPLIPVIHLNQSYSESEIATPFSEVSDSFKLINAYLALKNDGEEVDYPNLKIPNFQKTLLNHKYLYKLSAERRHELLKIHIKIDEDIEKTALEFTATNFENSFVIAIDYIASENPLFHPKTSFNTIKDTVKKLISQSNYKIFLVTNSPSFNIFMENEFPGHILTTDFSDTFNSFLINSLLLSRGNHLIRTGSKLSQMALVFNPKIPLITLEKSWLEDNS